jgi:membrane-associated phospholipid phosphatase
MNIKHRNTFLLALATIVPLAAQTEPNAGAWKTWILTSGSELRVPAPPDPVGTADEIAWLKTFMRDSQTISEPARQMRYWLSGAPSYRWVELALNQVETKPLSNPRNARALALMNIAVYDAMVAAWDSKYTYKRPRPARLDPAIATAIETPASPSFPSEHAVAAGAASEILAYAWPTDAKYFRDLALEAARAALTAGINYPSDYTTGLELGRAVALKVLAIAENDGSQDASNVIVPTGPGSWSGTNPLEPLAGTWKTWVLASGSQLRPGPPLAYNSPEKLSELAEVKGFQRVFATNQKALYYQSGEGVFTVWYRLLSQRLFESRLDSNAPRAARAYALASIAHNDASVACWDAKFTFWAPRPFQLDPSFVPLFASPNHPSYPAAHGCYSGAIARVIGRLFPDFADLMENRSTEAAESRIWAGIHFRSDVDAGLAIGRKTGDLVMERASQDGSN